jgi:hypothetical protein
MSALHKRMLQPMGKPTTPKLRRRSELCLI